MTNLSIGTFYPVTVVKLLKVGAIVELEDESQQLIHISKISDAFVADPAQFVSVGDCYVAEAIEGVAHPVELSLRHLKLTKRSTAPALAAEPMHRQDRRPARPEYPAAPTADTRNNSSNLDDMIARCNKSYEDKFGKGSLASGQSRYSRRMSCRRKD